ncbi:branched-chain amino acid ABC transporter ATP-binding protein/permease (plasmid) [Skermanella mucosa]|uniref:branched-chain amino acid ABC transporter ATP-binding protein/permease n=1 Tax=Skermanella mucosa TaxID=1789672 RepID=UPI00192B0A25|nr:branched-chain amino acid ABC transporter ATP-binding protein/permease [Skermanella mucosa]UEM25391.1 branched-chain amino acid ABC transporter ATP-binding protein/permease [Skermanella mucosa]
MQLVAAAAGILALPFLFEAIGLTFDAATVCLILVIAALGLNLLVGYTGLVSFGHGAWFGIGAYAAALIQLNWMPGGLFTPVLGAVAVVAALAVVAGFFFLRRRGVYFSLLTLAFTAMTFATSFRWTALTGGENGLGGIQRPVMLGLDFNDQRAFYALVAVLTLLVMGGLWRLLGSPLGRTLVAIRENEQRASFAGYPTRRYKLVAFVISSTVTGFAGALFVLQNRFASAEPTSIAFSGELLAMVVIGGMRSFLGPAIGAVFYILFREYLSMWTANWLLWFGLLFVGFILFSPTGLVGVGSRIWSMFRPAPVGEAAMANRVSARRGAGDTTVPSFLRDVPAGSGPVLVCDGIGKRFGGLAAVDEVSFTVRNRTLHALIGPNGAGKTTVFNLISGMFPPTTGTVKLGGGTVSGMAPDRICQAGLARSFQITNLFPDLSVEENIRLASQARHAHRFNAWRPADAIEEINAEAREVISFMGLGGTERALAGSLSYGGQRLVDMGIALASRPSILLLDEPLAGLAAAERERISALIRRIADHIPVLLVEHDVDRVFGLADQVTVMNQGRVLVDGTVEEARSDARVQEVYIGSGTSAIAARARESAAGSGKVMEARGLNVLYGKSHIINDVSFDLHEGEIVALLGRNGAGKSTLLKGIIGTAPPASGTIDYGGRNLVGLGAPEIARLGVGYVPQGRGLFAGMTVAENLMLGRLRRRTGAGRHWDEDRIFEFFPRLRERLDTPADYLSGGEQQMVAVARALHGDVRVLLLDEPFEGLSPAITEELFTVFDRLRREVSIIIVDHNLDLVLALSDRTYALERGRVVHQGPSRPLLEDLEYRREVLWL